MSGSQPYVICSRYEHALAHPSIEQGTSTFSKYLTTNVYKKKANTKGLKQLNLQATIPEQVNNSLQYIHDGQNNYQNTNILNYREDKLEKVE